MMPLNFLFLIIWLLGGPVQDNSFETYPADHELIRYSGRIDLSDPRAPVLISAASMVEIAFSGDSCQILLNKTNPSGERSYVSIELDGAYMGRIMLDQNSSTPYTVKADTEAKEHQLKIYKATEAQNGNVIFGGVRAQTLYQLPKSPTKYIEFIGNSITCGMGIDWKEIPCDSGSWYDQHNAYWAYGPRVARALDAQFVLSAVSGIGMYRNWNGEGPDMPEVYDNLYLNTENKAKWNPKKHNPDLVSICLGTNDFSDGDGTNERKPFDPRLFVNEYVAFVKRIYKRYPGTQVCLLTSPMVSGEKGKLFLDCLKSVKAKISKDLPDNKEIAIYNFDSVVPHGCSYHPDKDDHDKMAKLLIPFYKDVMAW